METLYNILLVVGILVAFVFSALVFFTGKGDAMAGGSGVRTTFRGKANFDDFVSRLSFTLGISFMALMLLLDIIANRIPPK